MSNIYPTSFCWKCGLPLFVPMPNETSFNANLFCSKKHQEQYKIRQRREQNKHNGKRGGYGLSGSCH